MERAVFLLGAYNRAGYDLLFDIDNFKEINDTCGHETGDRILKKVVDTLKKNFRSDDYVCRVGGDEFVVFLVHSGSIADRLIAEKIRQINEDLGRTEDGLPFTSVSAGIAHGTQAESASELFEIADKALYETKRNGKRGFTFSREQ